MANPARLAYNDKCLFGNLGFGMSTTDIDLPAVEAGQRLQRTDLRTRDLINQAIASIPTLGVQKAAAFLAAMNVPPEVAVRCLLQPGKRRPPSHG